MHTFSATLKTAGSQSLIATDTATSSIAGTQTITVQPGPGSVVGRFLFYSGSSRYDQPGGTNGRPASIPFSDDNAIATDKTAYLPNGASNAAATRATMSKSANYDQGINGIMVDLLGGGSHTAIRTNFMANPNASRTISHSGWATTTRRGTWATNTILPSAVMVRTGMTGAANGAGTVSGSDRVELIWAERRDHGEMAGSDRQVHGRHRPGRQRRVLLRQ